jgi:ADP-ribose pyrophosphatase YjhB (NUDIX family)
MYVTEQAIAGVERKYGSPEVIHLRQAMIAFEFDLLVGSMKNDRAHDVTLFIFKDSDIIAIRKHMHPEGVYRAPSGGLNPGEDFEAGSLREAREETGAVVAMKKYILRVHVVFTRDGQEIPWTSHVFTASYVSGPLAQIDTREIAEVKLVSLEQLQGPIRDKLLATGSGGLAYRVALTDKVVELLDGAEVSPRSEGS